MITSGRSEQGAAAKTDACLAASNGIKGARGYPRLPREAAAERSRPYSQLRRRTPCPHLPSSLSHNWRD